jgi:pimeloyl-ACP methyl ester carboxylesterase
VSTGRRSTSTPDGAPTISTAPDPIEFALGSGPVVRGIQWPGGPDTVLLLHDVGSDLDVWGSLPVSLAAVGYRVVATDLPGHGLSDDPWTPDQAPGTLAEIVSVARGDTGRCFVVAIGSIATLAARLAVDALVAISPDAGNRDMSAAPCLIFVGGAEPDAAGAADRFFRNRRGWAVVSSFGIPDNGAALLAGPWSTHLAEQTIAFLGDYRTPPTNPPKP